MERSFVRSFAHVEAHTGMNAELSPLGAQALTVGQRVAFADAQPAPSLVVETIIHSGERTIIATADNFARIVRKFIGIADRRDRGLCS